MRRFAWIAVLFVSALARGDAPVGGDASKPKMAVLWSVSQHFFGAEAFSIFSDATTRYEFLPPQGRERGRKPESKRGKLAAGELEKLRKVMLDHKFCSLRSGRNGVPDEAMPNVDVDLPGLKCSVTLWDGEWRNDPDASAVEKALMDLMEKTAGHR